MKKSKFHIAFLSAAILVSTTTFFSCSKEDETPKKTEPVQEEPETTETVQDDPKTTEISQNIKALAEKTTEGNPVELTLDEKITDEDFKFVAQALVKNENIDVVLNLSKVEISSIPEEAFKDVKNLTEIILPTTITEIKKAAFKDCIGLKNVTLGSKISKNSTEQQLKISASAFENCSDLDSVNISENNIEIDPTAFVNTNIAVLADNTFKAFKDAKYAQRVHVLAHVTEIPVKAFYLETTKTYQIYIGEEYPYTHRYNDYLKDVTFAKNSKLTKIGSGAFWGCYLLEEMNLPESIKIIGDTVFTDCSFRFKLASMPPNVEELGAAALRGLGDNKIVELPASLKKITGDSLFGLNFNPNIIKFAKNSQIKEISKDAFLYHSVIYYDDNMNPNYTELHLPIFCELTFLKDWDAEDKKRKIYVPQNLVEQFKAAECYKDCDIIAEE